VRWVFQSRAWPRLLSPARGALPPFFLRRPVLAVEICSSPSASPKRSLRPFFASPLRASSSSLAAAGFFSRPWFPAPVWAPRPVRAGRLRASGSAAARRPGLPRRAASSASCLARAFFGLALFRLFRLAARLFFGTLARFDLQLLFQALGYLAVDALILFGLDHAALDVGAFLAHLDSNGLAFAGNTAAHLDLAGGAALEGNLFRPGICGASFCPVPCLLTQVFQQSDLVIVANNLVSAILPMPALSSWLTSRSTGTPITSANCLTVTSDIYSILLTLIFIAHQQTRGHAPS
jgi:hypothetical protein